MSGFLLPAKTIPCLITEQAFPPRKNGCEGVVASLLLNARCRSWPRPASISCFPRARGAHSSSPLVPRCQNSPHPLKRFPALLQNGSAPEPSASEIGNTSLVLVLLVPHVLMGWHDPQTGILHLEAHTSSTRGTWGDWSGEEGVSLAAPGMGLPPFTPCL